MLRWVLLLVLVASCRQLFGFESATTAPADGPAGPDTPDAPIGCGSDEQCPSEVPICLEEICVECTADQPAACEGATPFCGDDNRCRGCIAHDECGSTLCQADGTCADPDMVAYVEEGKPGLACTQADPCDRLVEGLQTTRPIIKVTGRVTDTVNVNLNRSVDIYGAPGAEITRTTNGSILEINNSGVSVAIYGLAIVDGTGGNANVAMRVQNGTLLLDSVLIGNHSFLGVEARSGATLTMRRCIVTGNAGGGAEVENSTIAISNSLFVQNGSLASSTGGLDLKINAGSTFELNTIADNLAGTVGSGVRCENGFDAHSNIVVGNTIEGCTFRDSLFDANTPGGNRVGDPKFLSTTGPTTPAFYRIAADSAAIDGAVSTITIDIDGQVRPNGAAPDMGADEHVVSGP